MYDHAKSAAAPSPRMRAAAVMSRPPRAWTSSRANSSPMRSQSYRASTRARAATACLCAAARSASRPATAAANPAASSRSRISVSGANSSPSAPIGVATTGTPDAAASSTFNRVPPPASSGTTATAARAQWGRVSSPSPSRVQSGAARPSRSAGASRPRISTRAAGARALQLGPDLGVRASASHPRWAATTGRRRRRRPRPRGAASACGSARGRRRWPRPSAPRGRRAPAGRRRRAGRRTRVPAALTASSASSRRTRGAWTRANHAAAPPPVASPVRRQISESRL